MRDSILSVMVRVDPSGDRYSKTSSGTVVVIRRGLPALAAVGAHPNRAQAALSNYLGIHNVQAKEAIGAVLSDGPGLTPIGGIVSLTYV
ncbi:MAG: hypothetical protein JW953_13690 [Anaerolineae bacterium]|nr:hypothetical protein [Anaerolineae bacterium]